MGLLVRQIGPRLDEPQAVTLEARVHPLETRVVALEARVRDLERRLAALIEATGVLARGLAEGPTAEPGTGTPRKQP